MIANKVLGIHYLPITIHWHLTCQTLFFCYFRKRPYPKDHTFRWFDIKQSMFIFLAIKNEDFHPIRFKKSA